MTKETQTQAIAEPFKFKNAALLNRLSEMAQVPYYATACHTLIQAEMAIVELERENATLRAEVERLAAQSAPTGLTEMGWIIDAATKGELAAYDQGCDECQQAVTKILDGKDTGAGTANAPWELLRRRLLALVAQSAPLQQAAREYPPLPGRAFSIDAGSGGSVSGYSADQMHDYLDAYRAAAQVEPVRMLTPNELEQANVEWGNGVGGYVGEYAVRKFCRVNPGRVIPADGEVRS